MKFMKKFRDEQHECFGICIARLCEYEFNFTLTSRKWEKKKETWVESSIKMHESQQSYNQIA